MRLGNIYFWTGCTALSAITCGVTTFYGFLLLAYLVSKFWGSLGSQLADAHFDVAEAEIMKKLENPNLSRDARHIVERACKRDLVKLNDQRVATKQAHSEVAKAVGLATFISPVVAVAAVGAPLIALASAKKK